MSVTRSGISLLTLVACFVLPIAGLSVSTKPVTRDEALEPLLYAHAVIECTIESVHRRPASLSELGIPSSNPDKKVGILVAKLGNVVSLRGYGLPTEVQIGVDVQPRDLVGERLILCCYWRPGLNMFAAPFGRLVFRQEGNNWIQLRDGNSAPSNGQRIYITAQEVQTLVNETRVSTLAKKADIVVVGHVSTVIDTVLNASNGLPFKAERIVLKLDQVLKGNVAQRQVSFFVARGLERPSWYSLAPSSLQEGETWMAFLSLDAQITYLLGGVNGLLLIEGTKVFYDRVIELPTSSAQLVKEVKVVTGE